MNNCIFRRKYINKRCNNKCKEIFCHIHNKNDAKYEIINNYLKLYCYDCEFKSYKFNNLYQIYKRIYTNINKKEETYMIFKYILNYLFNKNKLILLCKDICYNKNIINYKKINIIKYIFNIFYSTYNIFLKYNNVIKLKILERFFKKYYIKKISGYYYRHLSINKNDPFTLDNIDDIDDKNLFTFKDKNSNIFTFDAINLHYYLMNKSNKNPFNNEEISYKIIYNLNKFIEYNNLDIIDKNKLLWETIEQSYTDVSLSIENAGFYNNVKWFIKLTNNDIIKIIKSFKIISDTNDYFNFELNCEDNHKDFVFKFCKDIIKIFENHRDNFLLCCNFYKSLSIVSIEFFDNYPLWLRNMNLGSLNSNIRISPNIYYINVYNNNFSEIESNEYYEEDTIYLYNYTFSYNTSSNIHNEIIYEQPLEIENPNNSSNILSSNNLLVNYNIEHIINNLRNILNSETSSNISSESSSNISSETSSNISYEISSNISSEISSNISSEISNIIINDINNSNITTDNSILHNYLIYYI